LYRVKLEGLKIYVRRGKWWVYRRRTGEALVRGFDGDRAELDRKLASPDFLAIYNRPRIAKREAQSFDGDTLGGLVHWYTNGDIDRPIKEALKNPGKLDDGYPKWQRLAASTRKDYLESFEYLRPEFDIRLADITQPDLYDLRDKCANVKWPRFADQMIAALSSAFRQAVKRSNKTGMMINPCRDMDKAHQADPNANREWYPEEWKIVERAPMEIKIPLMLARYVGMRGQTIVVVSWRQYVDHHLTGKAFRFLPAKTDRTNTIALVPVMPELQDFLASLKVRTKDGPIALRDNGKPWESEKEMQTRVSHWLRDRERDGLIGAGTTLHGLRSSYAAWLARNNANTKEVTAALGDKSERMGIHYTRHVEAEANVVRAFERIKGKPEQNENGT
jgi:integrase